MQFIVQRTSNWGGDPDCEEAKTAILPWDDGRESEAYVIDIKTMEQLEAFVQKYGRVIIDHWTFNASMPSIEIYDDYRE